MRKKNVALVRQNSHSTYIALSVPSQISKCFRVPKTWYLSSSEGKQFVGTKKLRVIHTPRVPRSVDGGRRGQEGDVCRWPVVLPFP